jgi:hypothetical protein
MSKLSWFLIIVGLLLFFGGGIWAGILSWSNPDMTERRLWMEFTGELFGITVTVIVGMLLFLWGAKEGS